MLEAGGAYLPLDPGYPRERLRLMLEDARRAGGAHRAAGSPAALPERAAAGSRPDGGGARRAGAGDRGSLAAVDPGNLVYLVYTSGSTGGRRGSR